MEPDFMDPSIDTVTATLLARRAAGMSAWERRQARRAADLYIQADVDLWVLRAAREVRRQGARDRGFAGLVISALVAGTLWAVAAGGR